MNTTGIKPTEYNVLVRLDGASEKIGGIYLPDDKQSRDQALQTRGVLIDASPLAFSYDSWSKDMRPAIGDKVIIAKGAGLYIDDQGDGHFYRLLKDQDVCAIVEDRLAALDKDIADLNKEAANV
ncbi:MAG: hypothetical protein AAGF20_00120 [Pseudomonadota bacterium]